MIHRATAFGLTWHSDTALPMFSRSDATTLPDVVVRRVRRLGERRLLMAINRGFLCRDGIRLIGTDASFDIIGGGLIEWAPEAEWSGTLPQAFASTIAAILLAWRGAVPLHGSAVEIAGRAVLLCGRGGAGKSTLAASLTTHGARLISDDLSVLRGGDRDGAATFLAGRPGLRLEPAVAGFSGIELAPIPAQRGKLVVLARRVAHDAQVPLDLVITLNNAGAPPDALHQQLFRPFWMASLPGAAERVARLRATAQRVTIRSFTPAPIRTAEDFSRVGAELAALIASVGTAIPDAVFASAASA